MKSSTIQTIASHNFKRFWIAGLSLGVLLIVGNIGLMIESSPMGIFDHQKAATAANQRQYHSTGLGTGWLTGVR